MKYIKSYYFLIIGIFSLNLTRLDNSQPPKLQVGAYYFDGWTGTYPYHITQTLRDSFPEREPKWGWVTSKQEIIDKQIVSASQMGLSFFSFCWYYNRKKASNSEPLNQALGLYRKSKKKNRLKYCLLVANHKGFEIGPSEWEYISDIWIDYFKDDVDYLKVDGKPLITFFSVQTLIEQFGSASEVNSALNLLRAKAVKSGLSGVNIAICASPNVNEIKLVELCGFDIITGYNYHSSGAYSSGASKVIAIDSLRKWEAKVWDRFKVLSKLKYIPVSTLNWDPRPWADGKNSYSNEIRYVGFSSKSVYNSLMSCKNWIKNNETFTTKENIVILYAWNENGEGAWLTPGKNGFNPADGLRKAIRDEK